MEYPLIFCKWPVTRYNETRYIITLLVLGTDHLISGGGAGIFPRDKLFFLSSCTTRYFFKSKLQQFFVK